MEVQPRCLEDADRPLRVPGVCMYYSYGSYCNGKLQYHGTSTAARILSLHGWQTGEVQFDHMPLHKSSCDT